MKKFALLSLALAVTAAVSTVGCGKNQDQPQTMAVAGAPALPPPALPPIPGGGTLPGGAMPIGCYQTQYSNCSQCPAGYTSNGSYCQYSGTGGGGYGCGPGQFYNGWTCQNVGYTTCPYGTQWSWYYYACFAVAQYPPASNCKVKTYAGGLLYTYVCF